MYASLSTWLMRRTSPIGVRRVASLRAVVASDLGATREENQDRAVIAKGQDAQGRTFVVAALCDGIGGMRNGGECAASALASFLDTVYQEAQTQTTAVDLLKKGAHAANAKVYETYVGKGGATLAAVLLSPDGVTHWLSVGDSRVYCVDVENVSQLSVDDTLAGQLGDEMESGLGRSSLLQFIGMGEQLEPHISSLARTAIGSLLLTSDGIHYLDKRWFAQIIRNSPDSGTCARRLVDVAKWGGGSDNASLIMLAFPLDATIVEPTSPFCIDVWDAYGELRLVSHNVSPSQPPTVVADIVEPSRPNEVRRTNLTKKNRSASPKTKKAKVSSRSKLTSSPPKSHQDTENLNVTSPQLLIKFPKKGE